MSNEDLGCLRSSAVLQTLLAEKKKKNAAYSNRAASKAFGISHSFLSLILSGKKKLSFKNAIQICKVLKLTPQTTDLLLNAVALDSTKDEACRRYLENALKVKNSTSFDQDFAHLELERFRVLSEWYHLALLDLTSLPSFKPDMKWIAEVLGVTKTEIEQAVKRLVTLGLLEINGKTWKKTSAKLAIPTHAPDSGIREFHNQMIEKALEALNHPNPDEFENRDISGITFTLNAEKIPEAKKRIQKFRREILEFFGSENVTELYQLNVQLFRLTKNKIGK